MRRFLAITYLWVLAIPLALNVLGAGLNQAVLIANHDRFPVMLNVRKVAALSPGVAGIIDSVHCVMTSQTHLNWLADIFDFHDGIYSPGDMILELSQFLWSFAPIVWCTLIVRRLLEE